MKRKRILLWSTAVLTALLCAALCVSVLHIYRSGMARRAEAGSATLPIFTREAAGAYLLRISPLAALWLASVIAARACGCAVPAQEKTTQRLEQTLLLLNARVENTPPEAMREREKRRRMHILCGAIVLLCAAWSLAWLLNGSHFQSWDLEQVMGDTVLHILPPLALAFAALLTAARLCDQSREREMDALLEVIRQKRPSPVRVPMKGVPETGKRRALRLLLYAAAAALIILGVSNGGLKDVLIKAINICTECIGLG